jgi:hypothetical protein
LVFGRLASAKRLTTKDTKVHKGKQTFLAGELRCLN